MSGFETVMNAFRGLTGTNPVAQLTMPTPGNTPAVQPAAMQTVATPTTAANGVVPVQAPAPAPTPEQKLGSQLEGFKDLWNTDPNAAAANKPVLTADKEKLIELARKESFLPQVTQEQMAAITAGGPEAAKAMFEVMNSMAQQVYAQSAYATTQIVNGAHERRPAMSADEINKLITKNSVTSSLQQANPLLSNPATRPMIDMISSNIQAKNPTASPQEVMTMTLDYLGAFASAVNLPSQQQQQQQEVQKVADRETNWEKYFQ